MFNRIIAGTCIACWAGAVAGAVIELPGRTHSLLLAGGIALLLWIRTEPGPRYKRFGDLMYAKGVHETLKSMGEDQTDAVIRRFPTPGYAHHNRVGRPWVSIAMVTAVMASLVTVGIAKHAVPMERGTDTPFAGPHPSAAPPISDQAVRPPVALPVAAVITTGAASKAAPQTRSSRPPRRAVQPQRTPAPSPAAAKPTPAMHWPRRRRSPRRRGSWTAPHRPPPQPPPQRAAPESTCDWGPWR